MNKKAGILAIALLLVTVLSSTGFTQSIGLTELVDKFKQATDLQRGDMVNAYFGKDFEAEGVVYNVEDYNFFNEKKDFLKKYYKITTDTQTTPSQTPYQVNFLFIDPDEAKDIIKGQTLKKSGPLIRLADERLFISVWLFDGALTPEEKELFQQ